MNTYQVKAVVCLQCNNCVINTRVLQRRASHNGALYKSSFLHHVLRTAEGTEEEWKESTQFHDGVIGAEFLWSDVLLVANKC